MTIVTGYLCNSGVILCADTQESIQGYVKTSTEKIKLFQGKSYTLAFAGAGDNAVQIDMVIQEICDELTTEEPKSLIGFKTMMHGVLDRLFPQPYYPKQDTEVELLLAVKENNATHLFVVLDNVFAESMEYDCIGAGVVLAKSMLQQRWNRNHSLVEAYIISAYVLYHAKRWVDGCGGNSDIFLLPHDSNSVTRLPSGDIVKLESYFNDLDAALHPLLTACPSEPLNDEQFRVQTEETKRLLWAARSRFQAFDHVFKRMMQEAGVDGEKMWAETTQNVDEIIRRLSSPQAPSESDSSQSAKP